MPRLILTPVFERSYRRLSPEVRRAVDKALAKLLETPPRPSLRLEPFKRRSGYWKARVNRGWRLLLRPESDNRGRVFVVADVGPTISTASVGERGTLRRRHRRAISAPRIAFRRHRRSI